MTAWWPHVAEHLDHGDQSEKFAPETPDEKGGFTIAEEFDGAIGEEREVWLVDLAGAEDWLVDLSG